MTNCKEGLFACGLLLFILCITLSIAAPQGLNLPIGASCTTSENEKGTCIPIKQCKSITDLIKARKFPATEKNRQFIEKNKCGFYNNDIKFCCANSPASGPPKKTKPSNCGKADKSAEKVYGGRPAELGVWPWMVALGYRGWADPSISFRCGASLIADEWLLTAAHCVVDTKPFELMSARLGDLDLNSTVKDGATPINISINKTYIHPQYRNDNRNFDVALARLNRPVEFTPLIRPICLFSGTQFEGDAFYAKKSPYALGWGATENASSSTALREVTVNVRSLKDCSQIYSEIGGRSFTDNILCAGEPGKHGEPGKDTCQGDSGGPLIFVNVTEVRFYLGGIVSAGKACGENYPGLYMKVAKFIPWINEVTGLDF